MRRVATGSINFDEQETADHATSWSLPDMIYGD